MTHKYTNKRRCLSFHLSIYLSTKLSINEYQPKEGGSELPEADNLWQAARLLGGALNGAIDLRQRLRGGALNDSRFQ